MTFQPGHDLSQGRPLGSANKRSEELRRRLRDRGDTDPADYCSSIVSNPNEPRELRLAAANYLLPYLYPKRGAITEPYRDFIEHPITFPHPDPKTIQQSNENILFISNLKGQGQIDQAWGDNLIADQCRVRDGLIDEAKLLAAQGPTGDMTIHIEGGLPTLPGTNIAMPLANGHELPHPGSPMIEAQEPGPEISSTDPQTDPK
jgi:hypothetical protein